MSKSKSKLRSSKKLTKQKIAINNNNNNLKKNSKKNNSVLTKNNNNNLVELSKNIFKKNNDIELLKKKRFDIWYNNSVKYPVLVREELKYKKVDKIIERRFIEDPFKKDDKLKKKNQYSPKEYKNFMAYGGSFGHNAPAGNHKIDEEAFMDTFLMSNVTPQEMVFNSGLWVILENYCKTLMKNKNLKDVNIFTGSFINKKNVEVPNINKSSSSLEMNIPTHMYKIIVCKHKDMPNNLYINGFLMENKPKLAPKNVSKFDLSKYSVSYKHICNVAGINIENLLHYYNLNPFDKQILPLSKVHFLKYNLPPILLLQMKKNYHFHQLIYCNDLEKLEDRWENCQSNEKEFGDLQYHKEYYELSKKRIKKGLKTLF